MQQLPALGAHWGRGLEGRSGGAGMVSTQPGSSAQRGHVFLSSSKRGQWTDGAHGGGQLAWCARHPDSFLFNRSYL